VLDIRQHFIELHTDSLGVNVSDSG